MFLEFLHPGPGLRGAIETRDGLLGRKDGKGWIPEMVEGKQAALEQRPGPSLLPLLEERAPALGMVGASSQVLLLSI